MYHQINDPCHLSLLPHSEIIKWQHFNKLISMVFPKRQVMSQKSIVAKLYYVHLSAIKSVNVGICIYKCIKTCHCWKYFTKKYYTIAQRFFLNRHMYVLFNMINEIFISMPVSEYCLNWFFDEVKWCKSMW